MGEKIRFLEEMDSLGVFLGGSGTNLLSNGLTWVDARDTCVSKNVDIEDFSGNLSLSSLMSECILSDDASEAISINLQFNCQKTHLLPF